MASPQLRGGALLPTLVLVALNASGAIVRNSRAFAGTGAFLSVPPGELKTVKREGNVLGEAKKAVAEVKLNFDSKTRNQERVVP